MSPEISRWTRPIEHQRVWRVYFGGIVRVRGRVYPLVRDSTAIEFSEERPKPVRVLVVNRNRSFGRCWHLILVLVCGQKKPRLSGEARPLRLRERLAPSCAFSRSVRTTCSAPLRTRKAPTTGRHAVHWF